ncbi:MAG: 2-phospho-L-lactate transferase [Acidimicrobiales bacterium]
MKQRSPRYVVLAGGVGAARLLRGLVRAVDPHDVTAIVNVADDIVLHGLHISPDLDTITYTLAGVDNTETGWGLQGETWQAMEMLGRYGGIDWFNLGDRDLGTHMFRTQRLNEGATLAEVTREVTLAWGIAVTVVPVTNDALETRVTVVDDGEIGFQEYFVGRSHDVGVTGVRFVGAQSCTPAPGILEAIATAEVVMVAPSNPIVSIAPLLAVPGVRESLIARRDQVVAVSPIVAGKALRGPADRLMSDLGTEPSVVGVADMYAEFVGTLVIDTADAHQRASVEATGLRCVVTDTIMSDPDVAAELCRTMLGETR